VPLVLSLSALCGERRRPNHGAREILNALRLIRCAEPRQMEPDRADGADGARPCRWSQTVPMEPS
jgi:hypothetical protein